MRSRLGGDRSEAKGQHNRWGEKREVHRKRAVGVREPKGQEANQRSETLKVFDFSQMGGVYSNSKNKV